MFRKNSDEALARRQVSTLLITVVTEGMTALAAYRPLVARLAKITVHWP